MITRYSAATARKKVKGSRVASAACLALNIMSCRPTTEISAVALVRTSQLLVKPGIARRIICGTSTRKKICRLLMP
ncbi:hypothetical protein D3C80_1604100 [compost metagenome]